jgi:hypothetical protein
MPPDPTPEPLTGRCYCGASVISAGPALTASYCHCTDCRRWTGAPVAAFAAVAAETLVLPGNAALFDSGSGVQRWTCPACGSPLACAFDYLPGQVYLPLGVLDQADALPPRLHSHADAALPWLHISDDLPRAHASARASLNASRREAP